MNSSPWVDPEVCRTCGECCKQFEIAYNKSCSKLYLSEIDRFQALSGIGTKITTREEEEWIWVVFHFPCRYLMENGGKYACAVYDSDLRPDLCQHFPYRDSTLENCPNKRTVAVRP